MIGKNLFVHGGLSHDLMGKYSIHEINQIVQKWLLKQNQIKKIKYLMKFLEMMMICHLFWCRLYGKDDGYGENTEKGYNELLRIINSRNQLMEPVSRVVVAHTPQFMEDKIWN